MAPGKQYRHRQAPYRRAWGRYARITDAISRAFIPAVFLMSCVTIFALTLYGGFEDDAFDKRIVMRALRIAQVVFATDILFGTIFRFNAYWKGSRAVKRFTALLVILSLVPLLLPKPGDDWSAFGTFFTGRYFLFVCLGVYALAEVSYGIMQLLARRTNPSLILSASFVIFILVGSFILMLPRCTLTPLSYIDALFMATSAVSMTGMSTVDIASALTPMGWTVIGVLMQVGAWGVLTFTSFFALFFSGRSSIYNQLLMRDFVYSKSMSDLLPSVLYILVFTLAIEIAGAVGIYFALPDGFQAPVLGKIGFSIFHSLSAFCNGGFSTLPDGMASSVIFDGNQLIYIVFIILILAGGIGFPNLVNFKDVITEYLRRLRSAFTGEKRTRVVHPFDINSRIVLIMTALLFIGGSMAYFVLEYNNTLHELPLYKKIVQSMFCAASVRTAGFGVFSPLRWLPATMMILMVLMWIGCASQSMGGGIKVNAFAAVVLNLKSIVQGQRGVVVYNRTISPLSIRRANAVVILSVFAIIGFSFVIMVLQPELPLKDVVFECFSATTTVGMSLGITPQLTSLSKIVIIVAMFLGRVGIISVLCGLVGDKPDRSEMLPTDDLIIN